MNDALPGIPVQPAEITPLKCQCVTRLELAIIVYSFGYKTLFISAMVKCHL